LNEQDCSKNFPDDPSIDGSAELLRRIPDWHFVFDENTNAFRPSSAAFEDDRDGHPMSVFRADIILGSGGALERVLTGHQTYALAAITAALARQFQQSIHPDPLHSEPSHAVVCGRKTKAIQRQFARSSRWIVAPPQR
jgi:hypothetical protein